MPAQIRSSFFVEQISSDLIFIFQRGRSFFCEAALKGHEQLLRVDFSYSQLENLM